MTPDKWKAARAMWEANDKCSRAFIADEFGVSLQAVTDRIRHERWTRESQKQLVHVPRPAAPRPPWRPTEFREEFADMLIAYFREAALEIVECEVVDKANNARHTKRKIIGAFEFPMIETFADTIDVSAKTLYAWSVERNKDGSLRYPYFSAAYERARELQSAILVRGGLAGVYNPAVSIFAAKNLLGWRDRIDAPAEDTGSIAEADKAELDNAYQRALDKRREQDAMIADRLAKARS